MNKELNKFLDEYPANKMYPLIYIINFVINSCGYIWNNFTKIVDYRFDKEYNFLNDDSETESIHNNTDSEYGTDDEDTIQDSDQDSDHKNKTNLNSEYGTDDEDTNIDSDSNQDSDHNNKTDQDSDHNNKTDQDSDHNNKTNQDSDHNNNNNKKYN